MKRNVLTLVATLSLSLLASAGTSAEAPRYKIVVNGASSLPSLSRRQIADYFLKRVSKWPDGTAVAVADLSATSATRSAFSKEVLEKSTDGVVHYWQQQIFSGRDAPPPVKAEEEILLFVGSTTGGIGYVAAETPLPAGIKVLKVAD